MRYMDDEELMETFLKNCCVIGVDFKERSGRLYKAYHAYALSVGEYPRSTKVFYSALDSAGYNRHRTKIGSIVNGLELLV